MAVNAEDATARTAIAKVIREEISPALANHVGGIDIARINGRDVELHLTASCRSCYFRLGCIEYLVKPVLQEVFDDRFQFTVTSAPAFQ